jgi:5'-deoxynucleotidase YfbR-like HD superfamily hydrolase
MSKASVSVYELYLLFSTLSEIRTGWKLWKISKRRAESILEHTQMAGILALGMYSEYPYKIDIQKVSLMILVHETEEIYIGDLTHYSGVTREKKQEEGHKAISEVFSRLKRGEDFISLIKEFDARETPEAKFAYMCDKLSADFQAKIYDDTGVGGTPEKAATCIQNDKEVQDMFANGAKRMSDYFAIYSQIRGFYDDNFKEVVREFLENDTHLFIKSVSKQKKRTVKDMKNKKKTKKSVG